MFPIKPPFFFSDPAAEDGLSVTEHKNLWFSNEAVKHRVETTSLIQKQFLPINSLDSLGTSLAIGGDNESIFLVENVLL